MKVYVGGAIWRNMDPKTAQSVIALARHPGFGFGPQHNDALIDRARSINATIFLEKSDADVHLSIDSDIHGFSYEDAMKVCEAAEEYGICGASFACRSPSETHPSSFYLPGVRVEHGIDHTPVEVKYVATGFMAVHRRVFEAVRDKGSLASGGPYTGLPYLNRRQKEQGKAFFPFYFPMIYGEDDPDIGQDIELSEDWAFCQRAVELGFKIYIDPAVRLGHEGSYTYRLEDVGQKQPVPQPLALVNARSNTEDGALHWEVYGDPATLNLRDAHLKEAAPVS